MKIKSVVCLICFLIICFTNIGIISSIADSATPSSMDSIPVGNTINRWGFVNKNAINVRSSPTKASDVIKVLSQDDRIWIYESQYNENNEVWTHVSVDGQEGYIMTEFVSLMSQEQSDNYQSTIPDSNSLLSGSYETFDPYATPTPSSMETPTNIITPTPGSTGNVYIPMQVTSDNKIIPASRMVIGESLFFVDQNGVLWSWGKNSYGQLGQGTVSDYNEMLEPAAIMDHVEQVFSDGNYAIALKTDHSLWAFGDNEYGQLGTGDFNNRNTPVEILSDVVTVSARGQILALKTDSTLWAWGWNINGCVGNGTFENQNTPVKVLDNIKEIHSEFNFSMALTEGGTLWMWGKNTSGALGNDSFRDSATPVKVMEGVKEISSIRDSLTPYCLTVSGDLYAWGEYELFGIISPAPDRPYVNKPHLVKNNVAKLGYCTNSDAIAFMNSDGSIDCIANYYDMYIEHYCNIFDGSYISANGIRELHCFKDTKKSPSFGGGYSSTYSPGVSIIDEHGNLVRWLALDKSVTFFDTHVETFISNKWINLFIKKDGSLYGCANDDGMRIFPGGPQLSSEPLKIYDINTGWK